MEAFDRIWPRIVQQQGELFYQKQGKPFRYAIVGAAVKPTTTNRLLSRQQFEKAHERMPVPGPGELQDLQGLSYLFAILSDARIASGNA